MFTYSQKRRKFWDEVHERASRKKRLASYYHSLLENEYTFLATKDARILDLGCGDGKLLSALQPALGVGVDFSREAIKRARETNPDLLWMQADAHALPIQGTFDIIILSDLLNDLWDVQRVFQQLHKHCHRRTRILINTYSRLWQIPLGLAEWLGLKVRTLPQNWFTTEDIENLFRLTEIEGVKRSREILLPINLPLVSWFFNKVIARLPIFDFFDLTNFIVGRPSGSAHSTQQPSVSIVIPARNEAGNIAAIFDRIPNLNNKMELIFVEGHSKDNTFETIEKQIAAHPGQRASLHKQSGVGKANAVWQGFEYAHNELLMILDSDLSVPPEDLSRFYNAAAQNKGEFINGTRLVYPMEQRAMQFANVIANKVFGILFSWLLGQQVKDTLCGTKVIYKEDFELLKREYGLFGKVDPFGDFDLLFGATQLNLKIIDLPIRYRERTYGQTNIQRWRHGFMLLRITLAAALELKFRP